MKIFASIRRARFAPSEEPAKAQTTQESESFHGVMDGKPGEQVARQGDQPAASGDGIDEARKHDQRADDSILKKCFHG